MSGRKLGRKSAHRKSMFANMANALIKYETIDAEQIARIMQGKDPGLPESWNDGGTGRSALPARRTDAGADPFACVRLHLGISGAPRRFSEMRGV